MDGYCEALRGSVRHVAADARRRARRLGSLGGLLIAGSTSQTKSIPLALRAHAACMQRVAFCADSILFFYSLARRLLAQASMLDMPDAHDIVGNAFAAGKGADAAWLHPDAHRNG